MEHSEELQYQISRWRQRAAQLAKKTPLRMKQLEELHRLHTNISRAEQELDALRRQLPLF